MLIILITFDKLNDVIFRTSFLCPIRQTPDSTHPCHNLCLEKRGELLRLYQQFIILSNFRLEDLCMALCISINVNLDHSSGST